MAAACWFIVVKKGFRKKLQRPAWRLYKLNEDQQEMYDGLYLAGALVAAIVFTVLLVVAIVLAIVGSA